MPPGEADEDPSFARIRREYPAILTTAHVAELLDLNPRTVLNMAADGRLPASRLPGSRKFHFFLEDVLQALRQHMVTPGSIPSEDLAEAEAEVDASPAAATPVARRSRAGSAKASTPPAPTPQTAQGGRGQRKRG